MGQIITAGEAERQAMDAHHNKRLVIFTNGCFDLIHVGHVRFLARCKSEGHVLIVGVNSDESVRSMDKGITRPINPEVDRVEVIAALAAVDFAVLFRESTPQRLIEIIHPDVLCKGDEWAKIGVVGREFVEEYGGRVMLVPRMGGWSTTQIASRIAKQLKEHV